MQACLQSEVVRLEKNLSIWKFLEFEVAGLSAARFVLGPATVRENLFKSLPKLAVDPKYAADLFRLAHADVLDICAETLVGLTDVSITPEVGQERVAAVAQLLTGGVKAGKAATVSHLIKYSGMNGMAFIPAVFQCVQKYRHQACFNALKVMLSLMLVSSGENFARDFAPGFVAAKDTLQELLNDATRSGDAHEIIAKLLWFALDPSLQQFLYGGDGLLMVVAVFQSANRNTQLLACLMSAVALLADESDATTPLYDHADEIYTKMEGCWLTASASSNQSTPAEVQELRKFATALCHSQAALNRAVSLLNSAKYSQYGFWLIKNANLGPHHIQQMSSSLATIL